MIRKFALLLLLAAALPFTGCDKIPGLKKKPVAEATPAPTVVAVAEPVVEPAAPAEPPKPVIDTKAEVVVLCYHRLEGRAGGIYSIEPALFEQHMQKIKDSGVPVISMQDFLAWRRGEKNLAPKNIIITLDDGYVSEVDVGVPILKKFGFTATFFVYTAFINSGGKSVSWAQLAELRDAGFEIGSHTVSHIDLRKKPAKVADYDAWLENEIAGSKRILEEQLGIKVATIAFPGGNVNDKVRAATHAAGYEAGFSVYGARLGVGSDAMSLGRYDVTAKLPNNQDVFTVAITFGGMAAPSGPSRAQDAAVSMITEPLNGETITNPTPTIKANLSTMGTLDAGSVIMRIGGLGEVPAQFDPASKTITFTPATALRPGGYTVIISAKSAGRAVQTKWGFTFNPDGASAPAEASAPEATPLPPRKKK
jgi:peptidoglycan/xylan/chitin deacetylase (PgdA/CDA1 family)